MTLEQFRRKASEIGHPSWRGLMFEMLTDRYGVDPRDAWRRATSPSRHGARTPARNSRSSKITASARSPEEQLQPPAVASGYPIVAGTFDGAGQSCPQRLVAHSSCRCLANQTGRW